jgi:hypothetical protein
MRFSLKTSEQTYGLEIGRTARSVIVDVRPRAWMYSQSVIGELHFYQPSHNSYFPCFRVVLIKIGLIERFSIDLEYPDHLDYSETLFDSGEF